MDAVIDLVSVPDLEAEMLALPQVEIPVFHHFGPGIYIREIAAPAGTLILGHAHRAAHLCVLQQGILFVLDGDGEPRQLVAPAIFTAPPGPKVGFAATDIVFQNIFATEETDVEKLEDLLVDKSAVWREFDDARRKLLEYVEEAECLS